MPSGPDLLTAVLLMALLLVLGETLRALLAGELFVPAQPRRPLAFDWAVLAGALLFIALNIVPVLLHPFLANEATAAQTTPTSLRIEEAILTHFVVIAVLLTLIAARRTNRPADYGIDARGWLSEMRYGGLGFLASLPFVLAVILLMARWRSHETQNPLLIVLQQTGSERTLWEVAFTAVASAPLAEELLFRVTFQGPLQVRLPRGWAIAIPAIIFASVHGPYDALPLLPLALVLGVLYYVRRSYIAIVTAHGLFNAAFLVLALTQRGA